VIDFQLGYKDQDGKTYFVSKWLDLPTVYDYVYGDDVSEEESESREKIIDKYDEIEHILKQYNFQDVHIGNMLYDENSNKIYIYDIFEQK
jgi:hypothetical protein